MIVRKLVAAAFIVTHAAGLASAKDRPRPVGELAMRVSPAVARCIIDRRPELVQQWLAVLPGSEQEESVGRVVYSGLGGCLGPGANMYGWVPVYDLPSIRAALVRALLQARRDKVAALPSVDTAGPAWFADSLRQPIEAADAMAITTANMGLCLAGRAWPKVVALILAVNPKVEHRDWVFERTAETSRRAEQAKVDTILTAMIPDVPPCTPAGTKLTINRLALRRIVEEAAFHLSD